MKWVYAPCAGVVRPVSSTSDADSSVEFSVAIEAPHRAKDRELVVVTPVSGVITAMTTSSFVIDPRSADERNPACKAVSVSMSVDHDKLKLQANVGDIVMAGQCVMRGRVPGLVLVTVGIEDPYGPVLCGCMDSIIYTAEPLMHIARVEVPVVEIAADGSVHQPDDSVDVVVVPGEVPRAPNKPQV